jgi:hypothetical protein
VKLHKKKELDTRNGPEAVDLSTASGLFENKKEKISSCRIL